MYNITGNGRFLKIFPNKTCGRHTTEANLTGFSAWPSLPDIYLSVLLPCIFCTLEFKTYFLFVSSKGNNIKKLHSLQ